MNNALRVWAVFIVGVAAGAAVALIYAPQSGEKTRRQLRRGLEDAGDYLKDAADTLGDHAEKYAKRGKGMVEDAVDSASNAVSAARKVIQI
jgi:gas vesicle protein